MNIACPKCGYRENIFERELDRLRERGDDLRIYTGGAIRETEAAQLLQISYETLRGYRKGLTPDVAPCRFFKNAAGGISYRIEDLASFYIGNLGGENR